MIIYKVPYNFKHEEKIFGGYISLRQMLYLILCIVSTSIFTVSILPATIKVLLFFGIVGMFLIFAFAKIEDINADKYFTNIVKFAFRKKIFIYER